MGRAKLAPKRKVLIYIPEELYAEFILLHPDTQDINGYTRYGAVSGYFTQLMRQDLEELKTRLRRAAQEAKGSST